MKRKGCEKVPQLRRTSSFEGSDCLCQCISVFYVLDSLCLDFTLTHSLKLLPLTSQSLAIASRTQRSSIVAYQTVREDEGHAHQDTISDAHVVASSCLSSSSHSRCLLSCLSPSLLAFVLTNTTLSEQYRK